MKTNENDGWEWARIQRECLRLADGRCAGGWYGCLGVAVVADHITPRYKGGTDDQSNLRALCDPCHDRVTAEQAQERAKEEREKKKKERQGRHPGIRKES